MKKICVLGLALCLTLLAVVPAGAATRDRAKPRVAFTTPDDAILIGVPASHQALAEWTAVRGTATDLKGRGIRKVTVTFCGNARRDASGGYSCGSVGPVLVNAISSRAASVGCTSKNRQRCEWTTPAPTNPGSYLVIATATDLAGNRRSAGPIFITVL